MNYVSKHVQQEKDIGHGGVRSHRPPPTAQSPQTRIFTVIIIFINTIIIIIIIIVIIIK